MRLDLLARRLEREEEEESERRRRGEEGPGDTATDGRVWSEAARIAEEGGTIEEVLARARELAGADGERPDDNGIPHDADPRAIAAWEALVGTMSGGAVSADNPEEDR